MAAGSMWGRAVRRTEDLLLLTGAGSFVEDLPAPGALWAAFVRSTLAHADIRTIEAEEARAMPGVAGVYTVEDLGLRPFAVEDGVPEGFARPVLATGVVRFAGEAIAVVLAQTRSQAIDAAEVVIVDYEPLPVVMDPVLALAPDAPVLFPHVATNLALEEHRLRDDGVLADAEVVVRARFVNQRLAPLPLETNAILAAPDGDDLLILVPHQAPFLFRDELAEQLGLDADRLHVIVPAVGGAFGSKAFVYPEQLCVAALAHRLRRPVRFVETRSENLVAMFHGRAQVQDVELGAKRDGTMTGLRAVVHADMGAYPRGTYLPDLTRQMASGAYRIPRIDFVARSVVTNTTPIEQFRGAGRPEAATMLERAVDMLARELGRDPVDLRRQNLIPADAFPYESKAGVTYDVGDYGRALDEAVRLSGYEQIRKEQAERRARNDPIQIGVGLAVYAEITAWGSEFGSVEVHLDGSATVRTGTSPQGQGHQTAFGQLVSGTLGIPFERIEVVHSDTRLVPRGEGTMGSRSLQLGGSAIYLAARQVLEKARRIAAHLLEASPDDIAVAEDGGLGIAGAPERTLAWAELADAATDPELLPPDLEPGLTGQSDFDMKNRHTFPFGTHVSVVEVDTETGRVTPLRHVTVDDSGRILNPLLAEGQIHGGVAQGIAQALHEEILYDEQGNPLTGSLLTYQMPSAPDLPAIEAHRTETPTDLNPLGVKGIGESGTIGSTPAVQNAVVDALSHLGVSHIDLPLTPERVWRAIRDAQGSPSG
ncbi:MAG TPA: xanthine dehydrogenase family protein molybdopterin-binding subunit [Actinomycetota bacterium]